MTHRQGHLIQLESRLRLLSKTQKHKISLCRTLSVKHWHDPTPCCTTLTSKECPMIGESLAMIKNYITWKCPTVNVFKRHNVKNPIIQMQCVNLRGGVFLSLIEMLRLTISWVDSFYWNCYQYGLNSIYPQSLCSTPCTINLIPSPTQRRAADDVMVPLSANYITGQLPLTYWLFKTIINIHWGYPEQCHK